MEIIISRNKNHQITENIFFCKYFTTQNASFSTTCSLMESHSDVDFCACNHVTPSMSTAKTAQLNNTCNTSCVYRPVAAVSK